MDYNIKEAFLKSREASRRLNECRPADIEKMLTALADAVVKETDAIISANKDDLSAMEISNPLYDRLLLTPERIFRIAEKIRHIAALPSPLGIILDETVRPNGMKITKVSVPFGVVGVIYEARPNVTLDVFSLCVKSGNACILKGGKDASHSNEAIVGIIRKVLRKNGIDENAAILLPTDKAYTAQLLAAREYVDLIIPRGSRSLIDFVRENAKIPVIETGAGIVHTYFDKYGDLEIGADIIFNAKTRRVSVCNALDCLLIHRERLADLPSLCAKLADKEVIIYADPDSYAALEENYPPHLLKHADSDSYGTEFLDYKMSIRTVGDISEAVEHIDRYSSRHSESIISGNEKSVEHFMRNVDAACVYSNVSTAFTDGGEFGLGTEIGISTQKLHARGPMGLRELTSYKYLITGDGQVRR